MATLADALRQFGPAYLATHALSTPQAKAWRGIVACRTEALGGERLESLQMPQPDARATECAHDFMARVARIDVHLCPCCKAARMRVTQVLLGPSRLPALCSNVLPQRQGPP